MPAIIPALIRSRFASITLVFEDANNNHKPLPYTRVRVELLNSDNKVSGMLFQGRSNGEGKVQVRIPVPKAAAEQPLKPLPKIRISVLDLDGDELDILDIGGVGRLKQDVQPIVEKPVAPIQVSTTRQRNKILAPIGDGSEMFGHKLSPELSTLLKQNKVDSLATLREVNAEPFSNLTGQDKHDLSELKAHAQLQLVSRNSTVNRALIKAGFKNIFDIAGQTRTAFVTKMKGGLSEKDAKFLHATAMQQKLMVSNLHTALAANAANGIGEHDPALPCNCNCDSAVSPQAYLVDLLDYAVDNVLFNDKPITLAMLEKSFGQPFALLPVDCINAAQLVRQVRLCIDVLHRRNEFLDEAGIVDKVTSALTAYVSKAYETMLRGLGTSYQELRLVRSDVEATTRLAVRLGIANDQVDNFRLEVAGVADRTLNETNLERLFGLQATARPPLAAPALAPAVWVAQRKAQLRTLWQRVDHPVSTFNALMVDPDIVDESELMQPAENPAYTLWQARKDDLQARSDELGAMGTITAMLDDEFGSAIDLLAWGAIADKLKSAVEGTRNDGVRDLEALNSNLTQEAFSFLLEIAKGEAANREIKAEERKQTLDVLVNLYKAKQFAVWQTEERRAAIRLSAPFFLLSEKEPVLNPLRASAEARNNWRAELEHNSTLPLIDPDIISASNFAPGDTSVTAFARWSERLALIGEGRRADDADLPAPTVGALFGAIATIDSVAKLDAALTNGDLPANPVLFHHIGISIAQLTEIETAFKAGTALPIKPEQYGLSVTELRTLFDVRQLAANADPADWERVHHILVQAEKRRYLYTQWRAEEVVDSIYLTPDVFHLPSDTLAAYLPSSPFMPGFLQFRRDTRQQRAWRDQLQARIDQVLAIEVELQSAIDATESATLPALRDDLVMATVTAEVGGTSLEERKRWVMNHLLINAFENGCRKTTRVAQAIETIQLLLWGIPSGHFEVGGYSLEAGSAATFDEEWKWLGSYATWRSAMFVYLYPENLLLPEYRRAIEGHPNRDTDPTKLFRAILKVMSGEAQPPSVPEPSESATGSPQPEVDTELAPFIEDILRALGDKTGPLTIADQEIIFSKLHSWRPSTFLDTVDLAEFDLKIVRDKKGRLVSLPSKPADNEINPYYFTKLVGFSPNTWISYLTQSAFLEDVLYIPLAFALSQYKRGDFDAALYWFGKVFDLRSTPTEDKQGWANPRLELYFKLNGAAESSTYAALEDWLNDALNPHLIAATRNGADARFVVLTIIRCLLDYADSEFSKDTSESIARARELYETARRLLYSAHLGTESASCDDLISLISEVGEGHYTEIFRPELDRFRPPHLGYLSEEARDSMLDQIKGIIKVTNPPKPYTQIRQEMHKIFDGHFAPKAPKTLKKVRDEGKSSLMTAYQRVLSEPKVFMQVQRAGGAESKVSPMFISAVADLVLVGKPGRRWVPAPNKFRFCIPRNPLIGMLRLRYEVSWFKLNNCMNLTGQHREVPAYAAPTDTYSGLPVADIASTAGFSAAARFVPTLYRYRVLIERAKQLVAMAQQMEATYFLEKRDQEDYTILRARQDLGIAGANVVLQDKRVTEAEHGKDLALVQFDRAKNTFTHYENLIRGDLLESEKSAEFYLMLNVVLQGAVAMITTGGAVLAGLAYGGVFGSLTTGVGGFFTAIGGAGGAAAAAMSLSQTAFSSTVGALSSASSYYSMEASFERRKQEWEFQSILAVIDQRIAEAQQTLAADRYNITVQEKRISQMSAENASDVVNFLDTKFTNAELYAWMGGIVGGIYRYLLQEATTISKLAQRQLAFERQESELAVVLDDYWTYTDTSAILRGGNGSADRRGMTGSARLLQDITRLDQEAFLTDRRKLQLGKTFSLALLDPIAFARFQESGVLPFATTLDQFDRNFPGHYLRLIKRVRVSVIALVPPTEGIRATLSTSGISRVVRGGDTFAEAEIRRDPESIAFTSPINATGLFELQEQPEMLLPFEGNGVAASWVFSMPRAANVVNYNSIADVLVTIEYTALDSVIYRSQVIQQLDQSASGERPFSIRQQFADAWYDLHNPDLVREPQKPMVVSFKTLREDFPPNVSELKIQQLTLYFNRKSGVTTEIDVQHLMFTEKDRGGAVGGAASTTNGLISTRGGNAGSWEEIKLKSPVGTWELALPDDNATRELFTNDNDVEGDITDILFVITYAGITPQWPV
jgi:Tc toxin complex TcA C-terminal TcB-binding domain